MISMWRKNLETLEEPWTDGGEEHGQAREGIWFVCPASQLKMMGREREGRRGRGGIGACGRGASRALKQSSLHKFRKHKKNHRIEYFDTCMEY